MAFACDDVEAPADWSNLAVAVVARRYFAARADGVRGGERAHLLGVTLSAPLHPVPTALKPATSPDRDHRGDR